MNVRLSWTGYDLVLTESLVFLTLLMEKIILARDSPKYHTKHMTEPD